MIVVVALFCAVLGFFAGALGGLVIAIIVWVMAAIFFGTKGEGWNEIWNIFTSLGSLIGLAVGFVYPFKKESDKKLAESNQKKAASDRKKAEEEASEAALYDIFELESAFDQFRINAKQADANYIKNTVIQLLLGKNLGNDEFERREFARSREQVVQEINSTPLIYVSDGSGYILEYDFEKKRFPFVFQLDSLLYFSPRSTEPVAGSETLQIEGYIRMDMEEAKNFRKFAPKVARATVVIQPLYVRHSDSRNLVVKLLALRLVDPNTSRPLLSSRLS